MKRVAAVVAGLLVFSAASLQPVEAQGGWTTLFDGKNMDAFNKVGDANWTIADGVLQADKGMGGYLVTKQPYTDFEIRAEFWVDTPANSGIFIRCDTPQMPGAEACYEVNIFDQRSRVVVRGLAVRFAAPAAALVELHDPVFRCIEEFPMPRIAARAGSTVQHDDRQPRKRTRLLPGHHVAVIESERGAFGCLRDAPCGEVVGLVGMLGHDRMLAHSHAA